jgi:hypothetical protein
MVAVIIHAPSSIGSVLRIWIRDLVLFTPGSGISFFRIPDPTYIRYISKSVVTVFWVENTKKSCPFLSLGLLSCLVVGIGSPPPPQPPHPQGSVASPLPLGPGGRHTLVRGSGENQFRRRDRHSVLYGYLNPCTPWRKHLEKDF